MGGIGINLVLSFVLSDPIAEKAPKAIPSVPPAICAAVVGLLDNRGNCQFPHKGDGKIDVVAIPVEGKCRINNLDGGTFLQTQEECPSFIQNLATLRMPLQTLILERGISTLPKKSK